MCLAGRMQDLERRMIYSKDKHGSFTFKEAAVLVV